LSSVWLKPVRNDRAILRFWPEDQTSRPGSYGDGGIWKKGGGKGLQNYAVWFRKLKRGSSWGNSVSRLGQKRGFKEERDSA